MGISDYIWPFEKKFSKIPCAREAGIAGLLGGPGAGAVVLMLRNKPLLAFKVSVYVGLGVFWLSFISCRHQHSQLKQQAEQFKRAVEDGKID